MQRIFPVYSGTCLLHKVVNNWVKKFTQGHSKAADDARPACPVETATEATALECPHGLAYSIMHARLKFHKCAQWVPGEQKEGSRKS
jgi:hypothetical protein